MNCILIRILWLAISLIPMPFLFHYYEISHFPNTASFLFLGTLLFVILTGLLSTKIKVRHVVFINIITIFISVVLGTHFIIPPNGSWFNPFGMHVAILFTGVVLLMGELFIRYVSNIILLKFGKGILFSR